MLRSTNNSSQLRKTLGFTLVELLIAVAILGLLLALGMPAYKDWAIRSKIRVAAEGTMSGLVAARNQAVQRNNQVHFYLTDNLTNACTLSSTGSNWIVSMVSPVGQCNAAPSETVDPRIIQIRSGREEGSPATINALDASNNAANRIIFTGLGRILVTDSTGLSMNPISRVDFTYPAAGTCQHNAGEVRCLRIEISTGGEARLCDPAVTDVNDPRRC